VGARCEGREWKIGGRVGAALEFLFLENGNGKGHAHTLACPPKNITGAAKMHTSHLPFRAATARLGYINVANLCLGISYGI
jgi:hypothetical protein